MATAFILITTDVTAEEEVIINLRKLPKIEYAYLIYGIYDIIVKINAIDINELKSSLLKNLRSIEKIRSTMTLIAFN